jgi:pseudouridine-5'-phosphate glycosidase
LSKEPAQRKRRDAKKNQTLSADASPSSKGNLGNWFQVSPQVRAALDAGRPVVALESTLIAHGLPYPQNLQTAHALKVAIQER